jgi:hypothetical protein
MGLFEKLETKMMDKIVLDYLQYSDIEILRNTCVYLHNYTRELRLSYRIFPLPRQRFYNKIIYLFLKWARIGREGLPQLSKYEIKDKYNQLVCPYYLQLLCPLKEEACNYSHKQIFLNRKEINLTKAYILYDELIFFIGDIFNPKFIWKYEIYIKELFLAYSHEEPVLIRKASYSKNKLSLLLFYVLGNIKSSGRNYSGKISLHSTVGLHPFFNLLLIIFSI